MNHDVEKSLAWALNQSYPSVAAQHAKTLAREIEQVRAENGAYRSTDLTPEEIFQMRKQWRDTEKNLRDSCKALRAENAAFKADIEAGRHARWICDKGVSACSGCGGEQRYNDWDELEFTPWCHNCGARMDGEEKDG